MASRRKSTKAARRSAPPVRDHAPAGVWLRAALVVVAGTIAYANALSGPFVLDDQDTIVLNEQIRQLSPSVVLFPAVELPVAGRPIVNLSFALNYAFGGLEVRGYHVVNVAIHIACGLLLFGIVRRTFTLPSLRERFAARSADLAAAAALIWVVHPLHTDAVDYVTQRTELMLGVFYLLALYASIRSVRLNTDTTYGGQAARWLVLSVVSCALGMASKESMVTAPLMILVYDRIFVFATLREAWQRRWRFYLSLAATWIVLAALLASGPRFRSAGFTSGVSSWTYFLNQTLMIVRYLRLAIWPAGLVVDYGVPRAVTVSEAAPYAALLVMLAALTLWALIYRPKVGFLGLWFFTTLSPTSSVVPIATEVGAERRMYLPLAAIVVLAVVGLAWVLERWAHGRDQAAPRRAHGVGLVALAVVVLAFTAGTMSRNREYSSAVSLVRTTVDRWPNPRARHSLGVALLTEGQREAGITELRQAVADDPAAYYTLGVALYQDGKLDEAVQHLREFLTRESNRIEVPVAHELVGRILKTQGRFTEAEEEFRKVLGMTPSRIEVHGLLAESLFRQEKFDQAIDHYQQFLASRPADVAAQVQLGIAYAALSRHDEAIAQFRRVVALNPQDSGAHRNLAHALLDKGMVGEGVAELRRAVELNPADARVRAELDALLRASAGNAQPK